MRILSADSSTKNEDKEGRGKGALEHAAHRGQNPSV
jgi:hypothetical protein